MKMNPELKAKWIEALLSGKYRQATGRLKSGDAFCCLGVLREIIDPNSNKTAADKEVLCRQHQDEAKLTMDQQDKLSAMNDRGNTFYDIADWIEANL